MGNIICGIDEMPGIISVMLEDEFVADRSAMARGIDKTMAEMVAETKATAPTSVRKRSGTFARHIMGKSESTGFGGHRATWGVKDPEYRLTHLVANGHETRNGGRAKSNPFLHNAHAKADASLINNIRNEIDK